jgi:hypothetical protein
MEIIAARAARPGKEKGRPVAGRPFGIHINGDAQGYSSSEFQSQLQASRQGSNRSAILSVAPPWHPVTLMALGSGIGFSAIDIASAAKFHDRLVAARDAWLRKNNRRLPHPDQLDRERYGIRRGGVRHG